MSSENPTTIVIGAGIVGLCMAHELKKANHKVVLIDAEEPGSQCSFGNAGALSSGSVAPLAMPGILKTAAGMLTDASSPLYIPAGYWLKAAPWLLRFVAASNPKRVAHIAQSLAWLLADAVANHQRLATEIGCPEIVRHTGQLHLYPSPQAMSKDDASWALKREHGLPMQAVDRAAIAELEPSVSARYRHGIFLPDQAWLADPQRYTRAIAAALREMGVLPVHSRIASLGRDESAWFASDGSRRWRGDNLVICAGMGSKGLLSTLGLSVPLESQRGYHVQIANPGIELSRVVVLADRKAFMTPMEPGLRIAGTVEFGGTRRAPNEKRALLLKRDALSGLQGLDASRFTTWMGHRPCLPDSLPVIGPVDDSPGLWCAFGHGHLGVTGSVNTAKRLVAAMGGQDPDGLSPFLLSRFRH
jgi:D-amino-acid dehydrogenase